MPGIDMKLEASWLLSALLLIFAMAGLAIVVVYIADWRVQLTMTAWLLATTAYHVLRDGAHTLPSSWKQLHVSTQGGLQLINRAGQVYSPKLAGSSWVHPWLTVLYFEKPTDDVWWHLRLPPVILLADANADDCRRLRMWLRWWRHSDRSQADSSDLAT